MLFIDYSGIIVTLWFILEQPVFLLSKEISCKRVKQSSTVNTWVFPAIFHWLRFAAMV